MKSKLQHVFTMLVFLFTTGMTAQQESSLKMPLPATNKMYSPQLAARLNRANAKIALTTCGPDTLVYPYLKELAFSAPNDSFFVDAMVGNVRTASQAYVNTNNINVRGIQFWGNAYTPSSTAPQLLQAKVILYAVDATYKPTTPIDSALVTITDQYDFYEATFTAPHSINTNFAVAVKSLPNDTISIITNNAGNGWAATPYGEGLAWRRFGSGVWNSSASFFGQDLEYMIFPIVDYTISASFGASTNSVCPGFPVTYTNTTEGPFANRMFNLYAFDQYWGFAAADSSHSWNYTGAWNSSMNGSYTYPAGGTYTTTMASGIMGYYTSCTDTARMNITVFPTYNNTVSATICKGEVYGFGTQTLTIAGAYTQTLASVMDCDSVVTVNLSVDSVITAVSVSDLTITATSTVGTYQWVDCNNNYAHIPGENNQSFEAMPNGSYAVIVTNNGCSDTSACITITSVGIRDAARSQLSVSVFPNPTTGVTKLNCNGSVPDEVRITNIIGDTVKVINPDKTTITLDLSEQPSSVYFVEVKYKNASKTIKLMKH